MRTNHHLGATTAASARTRLVAAAAALASLAALIFVLHPPAINAARAKGPVVSTTKTSLGRILIDSRGRTLYLFEKDGNRRSACYGQCATFWPPLLTHGKPVARGSARKSLLGTTRRANASQQVTYAGHPLYRYVQDRKPGQTTGEGSLLFGAGWDALSPAGKKIESDDG